MGFLNKACIFIKDSAVADNQYSYVFIDLAVSFRGKDPFSKSGSVKFEITMFLKEGVTMANGIVKWFSCG